MAPSKLLINEIFHSIQGESTWSGLACVFVRLRGCHLRCNYCDTEYAFHQGEGMLPQDVIDKVNSYHCNLVEITGGEPLLQKAIHPVMTTLCNQGKTVLIETSGACDISLCDERVIRIMDFKTPGSGEVVRNHWPNVEHLRKRDEVKFVLCDRRDYLWARELIQEQNLASRVNAILMSAAAPMKPGLEIRGVTGLSMLDLANWILEDGLPVRLQTQLHKIIWDPMARGV